MAETGFTVTPPVAAEAVQWTGLNQYIMRTSQEAFLAWLGSLVPDATDEVATIVGEDLFDGNGWTRRKARMLSRAIAYYTAAAALVSPELQRVTGTHSPLTMDDAESIAAAQDRLRALGKRLINQVTADEDSSGGFAAPVASSSTFTGSPGDRPPSARNELLDERDDVGSWNAGS